MSSIYFKLRQLLVMAGVAGTPLALAQAASAPYPASTAVPAVSFDWATYKRLAPGSDNWPITWSADDRQYTSWGDGGGFESNGTKGKVSLGLASVEGTAGAYKASNVWGGLSAKAPATFKGKSYGILALGTDLYMWRCGGGSGKKAFDFQQLHKSTNGGLSWQNAGWQFSKSVTFYCPSFLQFGQGHAGARDGYVYMYAPERNGTAWDVQKPGKVALMRAPKDRLLDRSAYEFFAGNDAYGAPRWSTNIAQRAPAFADPNGTWLTSVIYNPGLGRYLLLTTHAPTRTGGIGLFDAPEPWGPWTTVLYQDRWGAGHIETSTFFLNFAAKWWSDGGRGFVLVFTGDNKLDAWNSVQGSFAAVKAGPGKAGPRKQAAAKGGRR